MYVGHAALALLAKAKRPSIAIAVLVPVAFAPDWIKVVAGRLGHENREISHSLVSIGICATLVAGAYYLATKVFADALVIWLTYLSHWPADFITGIKPTWPGGPNVGLLLYAHPLGDIVVECAIVLVCYAVYRRSLPAESRGRAIALLVPLGLIGMQIIFEAIQSPDFG